MALTTQERQRFEQMERGLNAILAALGGQAQGTAGTLDPSADPQADAPGGAAREIPTCPDNVAALHGAGYSAENWTIVRDAMVAGGLRVRGDGSANKLAAAFLRKRITWEQAFTQGVMGKASADGEPRTRRATRDERLEAWAQTQAAGEATKLLKYAAAHKVTPQRAMEIARKTAAERAERCQRECGERRSTDPTVHVTMKSKGAKPEQCHLSAYSFAQYSATWDHLLATDARFAAKAVA
jgi:hypothetical protein